MGIMTLKATRSGATKKHAQNRQYQQKSTALSGGIFCFICTAM